LSRDLHRLLLLWKRGFTLSKVIVLAVITAGKAPMSSAESDSITIQPIAYPRPRRDFKDRGHSFGRKRVKVAAMPCNWRRESRNAALRDFWKILNRQSPAESGINHAEA
jgi:hypothetical protein